MEWCKLHTDILGDPKLMRAARTGAAHLVVLPWLLAWAKAHDSEDRGRLLAGQDPADAADIARDIPGVTVAEVDACLTACIALGVLRRDEDGAPLRFARWERRSGVLSGKPSDDPARVRERVARHRAKQSGVKESAADDTQRNACNALRNAPEETRSRLRLEETSLGASGTTSDAPLMSNGAVRQAVRPTLSSQHPYPPEFESVWTAYPSRGGATNPKQAAFKAWNARIRAGIPVEDLAAGVTRYAAHCTAEHGDAGSKFVMQAVRFFGPDEHWREAWPIAPAVAGDPASARAPRLWAGMRASGVLRAHPGPELAEAVAAMVADGSLGDPAELRRLWPHLKRDRLRNVQTSDEAVRLVADALRAAAAADAVDSVAS